MVQIQLFILFYGLLSLGIKYFIFVILYYLFLVFEVKIVIIGIIVQVQRTSSLFLLGMKFFYLTQSESRALEDTKEASLYNSSTKSGGPVLRLK